MVEGETQEKIRSLVVEKRRKLKHPAVEVWREVTEQRRKKYVGKTSQLSEEKGTVRRRHRRPC